MSESIFESFYFSDAVKVIFFYILMIIVYTYIKYGIQHYQMNKSNCLKNFETLFNM